VVADADRRGEAVIDRARADTGLDDFGPWAWRDGLEVLFRSAAEDGDLNPIGLGILESWALRRLTNRLRVIDWVKRHPAVRDERVERPLIVLGMLRTGTTILCELLARDPGNRPLMKWEGLSSVPPPERKDFATDPRIEHTVAEVEFQMDLIPEFRAVHYEPGDGPTECVALLTQAFRAQDFFGLFRVPAFVDWYRQCDLAPAYAYHRLSLQLLQCRAPGRWSLKAPGHMHALDVIRAVYPDARLVVTHRDPQKTVASSASLSTTARPETLRNDRDRAAMARYFGELWLEELGLMVDRMMEFRDREGDAGFYDLHFHEFVRDPVGEIEKLYAHFGEELSPPAAAAMHSHLRRNIRGKHGEHRYQLEDFGLGRDRVRGRFSGYVERFGVDEEA
jgi:hypothetical protein